MHTLNRGSSMTMSSKGIKAPWPHRIKMPWTASCETVPDLVLNRKDKVLIDGKVLQYGRERMAQPDPLEVLKNTVAKRKYEVSTGQNVAQIASQLPFWGRGQKFYRAEWKEGTYDKHFTLCAIEMDRDSATATVYGYVTFHGETSLEPVEIRHANVPGWLVDFDEAACVPFNDIVQPPPSIGTDVPVDPKKYKLKAYPYYDPPNPAEFVDRLLKERGVLPDITSDDIVSPPPGSAQLGKDDSSVEVQPA